MVIAVGCHLPRMLLSKMGSSSPSINLVVIRSTDVDRTLSFYRTLGLDFEQHQHGSGPLHYAAEVEGIVFEIYATSTTNPNTAMIRLGFSVDSIDELLPSLEIVGAQVVSAPKEIGRASCRERV